MRTILGPKIGITSVTVTGAATGGVAAAPAGTKADPTPIVGTVHAAANPFAVDLMILPYDLATNNHLLSVTVVMVPHGHGLPSTAADYMASSYPKGTLDVSTVGNGTGSSANPPVTLTTAPVASPVAAPVATAVATAPASIIPTPATMNPATTATATAPPVAAPVAAGTLVTVAVPGVPAGDHVGQVLLTYDN